MNATLLAAAHVAPGDYPERADAEVPALLRAWRAAGAAWAAWRTPPAPVWTDALQRGFEAEAARLPAVASLVDAAVAMRVRLARDADAEAATGAAFALVAEAMSRTLGKTPYPTQRLAAWGLLQGHLVEMATGEGKTLAAGLGAAVAALGGQPVHVLTANDYLVRRDRDTLAPVFDALGLSSACVTGALPREQRAAAWRHAIVYSTAREVAFDYLRDHAALRGGRHALALRAAALDDAGRAAPSQPVLPGLHCAIVDEADSLLLDEAVVPLLLAAPQQAVDAPAYRRALAIAQGLQAGRDYQLRPATRSAVLSDAGRDRVGAAVRGERGTLALRRRAEELVEAALAACHLYRRDHEYAIVGGKVALIDELTGRLAEGRQWRGALHPMVELKEGLEPSQPTETLAQITYQRFFPRYLHLAGMSGTLAEARTELSLAYGCRVRRIPLARPDRRRWLGERLFVDAAHQARALVAAVRDMQALGRPVLVGTGSVAESARLSALLHAGGIAHQVLNATQDADEAGRVARAGTAGTVTLATNIAGRGTDIHLDDAARRAGGLHVIATMRNRSPRVDRQLVGRAARHGDPGSAQALLTLDDALLQPVCPPALRRALARLARDGELPARLARPLFAAAQAVHERRDRIRRRDLRDADRHAADLYGFAGGTE